MVEPDQFLAIRKLLFAQAFVIVLSTNVALGFVGVQQAISTLVGGLIAFLPNVYFALKITKSRGLPVNEYLRAFYFGEAVKLVLTAILFVLVFQLGGILFLPLFIGFIAVTLVYWFALLVKTTT